MIAGKLVVFACLVLAVSASYQSILNDRYDVVQRLNKQMIETFGLGYPLLQETRHHETETDSHVVIKKEAVEEDLGSRLIPVQRMNQSSPTVEASQVNESKQVVKKRDLREPSKDRSWAICLVVVSMVIVLLAVGCFLAFYLTRDVSGQHQEFDHKTSEGSVAQVPGILVPPAPRELYHYN